MRPTPEYRRMLRDYGMTELPRAAKIIGSIMELEYEDVLQECMLAQLEGVSIYGLQHRLRKIGRTSKASSLSDAYGEGELEEILAQTKSESAEDDVTFVKTIRAFAKWIQKGALSELEADMIFMHAVEGWSFPDVAAYRGNKTHSTAFQAYHRGIKKLRARYADVMEQAG